MLVKEVLRVCVVRWGAAQGGVYCRFGKRRNSPTNEREAFMLVTKLETAEENDYLACRMRVAYAFLQSADVAGLPLGQVEIQGKDVFANVQEYETVPASDKAFEAHRLYYDVQYVVSGEESFYYAPLEGLAQTAAFDESSDFGLYQTPAICSEIRMEAGDVVVVAPEDAHKPGCIACAPCRVRKIVVKVRM